jgi:hypothetical protein
MFPFMDYPVRHCLTYTEFANPMTNIDMFGQVLARPVVYLGKSHTFI